MVFKSKKETAELLKKDLSHPGPGDYLQQTINKKDFHINNLLIKTKIEKYNTKLITPGPGHYFQNEKPKIKKIDLISNKNSKSKISYEKEKEIIEKYNNKIRGEKLGFNIKAERFKKSKDFIKQPGPGEYFPDVNKFYKKSLIKKIKDNYYKPRKMNRNKDKYNLILAVPSIPTKEQKYGFNVLEDGILERKKAPNFNQTFTGEKGDTVGPGYYEVDIKDELYKTRPKWTISKDSKSTTNLISTYFSDNSRFLDNSNLLSSVTANKFFVDDNLNVKELCPYNISNNSFASFSNSNNLNSLNKSDSEEFIKKFKNKNIKFKRAPLSFTYHGFYRKNEENKIKPISRLTFKLNTNPGPGFYIDRFKNSSFNFKSNPASCQFFGSNASRFNYKNEVKIKKNSVNIEDDKEELKPKKINKLSIPFFTLEQRFKVPHILIEQTLSPSPTHYYPKKMKKNKSFSNFMKFSSATRFIEKKDEKWLKEIPGPGLYNPEQIKSHINSKKIFKTNDYINKIDIYKNQLNDQTKTIAYENYKRATLTKLNNVSFFKTNPSLKKAVSCRNITPAPGFYHVNRQYEIKQILPPFNSSLEKKVLLPTAIINKAGPGQYMKDSYFDWNKKSFNISFL